MYESLLEAGRKENLDMVCASWIKEETVSYPAVNRLVVKRSVFGRDDLLRYIYRRDDYQGFAYMWDKLYKRELFSGISFDEDLRIGGDVLALAEVSLRVRRALYLDRPFYHYRQRVDSGCHTGNAKALLDWVKAYDHVLECFAEASVSAEIMLYVKRFSAYTASRAAKAALASKDQISHQKAAAAMQRYQAEYEATNQMYPNRIRAFREIMEWRI